MLGDKMWNTAVNMWIGVWRTSQSVYHTISKECLYISIAPLNVSQCEYLSAWAQSSSGLPYTSSKLSEFCEQIHHTSFLLSLPTETTTRCMYVHIISAHRLQMYWYRMDTITTFHQCKITQSIIIPMLVFFFTHCRQSTYTYTTECPTKKENLKNFTTSSYIKILVGRNFG